MQPVTLSAIEAATYLGLSERKFHGLRKSFTFPKPRLIGSRSRWLRNSLDQWVNEQPVADPQPEPQQLSRSTKRKSSIEPKPEVWPVPNFVNRTEPSVDSAQHGNEAQR